LNPATSVLPQAFAATLAESAGAGLTSWRRHGNYNDTPGRT